jgi:hypothetical protein
MHHQSPPRQSPNKKFKSKIGRFVDMNDGVGPRFLLTDDDIDYIKKSFFLM